MNNLVCGSPSCRTVVIPEPRTVATINDQTFDVAADKCRPPTLRAGGRLSFIAYPYSGFSPVGFTYAPDVPPDSIYCHPRRCCFPLTVPHHGAGRACSRYERGPRQRTGLRLCHPSLRHVHLRSITASRWRPGLERHGAAYPVSRSRLLEGPARSSPILRQVVVRIGPVAFPLPLVVVGLVGLDLRIWYVPGAAHCTASATGACNAASALTGSPPLSWRIVLPSSWWMLWSLT